MTPRISVFALALIISSTGFSATQVYKKVLPDGSTSFSDEEQDNAEVIMVEPVPTVPAFKAPPSSSQSPSDDGDTQDLTYSKLEILSPSNNAAFHTGSGTVEVNIESVPELHKGHRFKIFLGNNLLAEQRGTQVVANNVPRGTHQLSVNIVDRSGSVVKSTNSSFTIHRPSIKN